MGDERKFCFVFTEAVLAVQDLPSIVNGSFAIALKPLNDATSTFRKHILKAISRTDHCANTSSNGRCDCLRPSEKEIFLQKKTSNNMKSCAYPDYYDAPQTYSAIYSYDSVV